jgi:uncharacterized protein YjbI with pentapeptide repeats
MRGKAAPSGTPKWQRFAAQVLRALARDTPAFSGRRPGANLSRAKLQGAALEGADLDGVDLGEANLHEAKLIAAHMANTDLHQADLGGADLRCAYLAGANLQDAQLADADLRQTIWSRETQWPADLAAKIQNGSDDIGHGEFRIRSIGKR